MAMLFVPLFRPRRRLAPAFEARALADDFIDRP